MSNVVLSAGVRQNLLSLQSTAQLMSLTQNRLATGKKVNTALDNPSNFFTSQSLNDRATDLNALLDAIGQGQKILEAANQGITSLTKLVQSAKATAQQARQSPKPVTTYAPVSQNVDITSAANLNGSEIIATAKSNDFGGNTVNFAAAARTLANAATPLSETLGQVQAGAGNAITPVAIDLGFTAQAETLGTFTTSTNLANDTPAGVDGNTLSFTVNDRGTSYTFTTAALADADDMSALVAKIGAASDGGGHTLSDFVNVASANSNNNISFTAISASTDLTITASADTAALGLTADASTNRSVNSTSLLDNIGGNATLALDVNGTGVQTLTFANANIVTLADLNTAIGTLTGLAGTSGVTGTTLNLDVVAGASNSLVVTAGGATPAGLKTALGLGTTASAVNLTTGANRGGLGTGTTRTYNSDPTLAEIDPTNLGSGGNLVIALDKNDGNGSSNRTVALLGTDKLSDIVTKIQADTELNANVTVTTTGGRLTLTAKSTNVDIVVQAGFPGAALGLTADAVSTSGTAGLSTSLLDTVGTGQALTFTVVNGITTDTKTVTIGTGGPGANQVQTLAELSTWINSNLGSLGGAHTLTVANTPPSTSVTGSLNLVLGSGATNTVTVSGSAAFSTALKTGGLNGTYNSAPTFLDLGNDQGYDFTNGGNLTISVNGSVQTVGLAAGDRLSDIVNKLRANATLDANLTFADDGSGHLQVTAKNADVDFAISPNTVSDALGLTADAVTANNKPSTSLLDLLNSKLNGVPPSGNPASTVANGATLTLAVNGGTPQTITFGTGSGQVSTFADLQTALTSLNGINGSLSGATLNLQVPSDTSQTSLTVSGSNSGAIATALGLTLGTQSGLASPTTDNSTRTALQSDFNTILVQADNLVKDASYNGINLLYVDDLKIIFNESGASSLTITGVRFDTSGLGLSPVNGSNGLGFQDDTTIDQTLARIDAALASLRSQASKFGSNLTTVQTRQDFTKNMITTLQTGADQLVLADTNEEGANMLALQTRQQLSTTALSLSSQADQAVLRLFG